MTTTTADYDVIVIGARCAGSATARLLAAAGHRVLVVDRAALPSDTLSTHGIARGGVVQLARWGLLDDVLATGAPAIRDVTFRIDGTATTYPIKDRAGVDLLVAPRRFALDAVLAGAARAAGATVQAGTTLTGLLHDATDRVTGIVGRGPDGRQLEATARFVVGADGRRSTTARLVDAQLLQAFEADVTIFYAYVDQVDWHGFEFAVGPQAFAGVFPTQDGQACVWLTRPSELMTGVRGAGSQRAQGFAAALAEVDAGLGRRVRDGRIASPVRGSVAPSNYVRQAFGPGWALVGDAGYHRDPITGHGITDAFRDAELLARALDVALREPALERQSLDAYAAARDDALGETFQITEAMARFPDPTQFGELQMRLGEALDREAQLLASLPTPFGSRAASAA
ncbi:MAG: NAD(P)/FAD-dependent oxidoreductase [Actinomycetota bacterium]|nr:NAD(P)/FAD-dependent oxidoreductase [Actinomycetota bacterium]